MKNVIIFFGKVKPRELTLIQSVYTNRLNKLNFKIVELRDKYSAKEEKEVIIQQEKRILNIIKPDDFLIICDERGYNISTNEIKEFFFNIHNKSGMIQGYSRIVFAVGGVYGFSDNVRNRSNLIWSLSKLVLAGGIARLVLLEALYRCMMILNNHPYHNE